MGRGDREADTALIYFCQIPPMSNLETGPGVASQLTLKATTEIVKDNDNYLY